MNQIYRPRFYNNYIRNVNNGLITLKIFRAFHSVAYRWYSLPSNRWLNLFRKDMMIYYITIGTAVFLLTVNAMYI